MAGNTIKTFKRLALPSSTSPVNKRHGMTAEATCTYE